MSNETEQQQLWTDERIEEETERHWKAHGETYQYLWVREMMRQIRDDCLADRAALHERLAALEAEAKYWNYHYNASVQENNTLTAELEAAREWEVCDIETKSHLITRAQFRGITELGYRLQRPPQE